VDVVYLRVVEAELRELDERGFERGAHTEQSQSGLARMPAGPVVTIQICSDQSEDCSLSRWPTQMARTPFKDALTVCAVKRTTRARRVTADLGETEVYTKSGGVARESKSAIATVMSNLLQPTRDRSTHFGNDKTSQRSCTSRAAERGGVEEMSMN
jgi:hypothetical protein